MYQPREPLFPLQTWEEVPKPLLFLHQPQGQGEGSRRKSELGACSQCKWQNESVKVKVTISVDKSWLWALKLDRKPIVGDVGLEWKQAQSAGLSKTVLMFYLSNGPGKWARLRLEIHIFSRTHRFSIRQVDMGKNPQGELWFLYFSDAVIVYSSWDDGGDSPELWGWSQGLARKWSRKQLRVQRKGGKEAPVQPHLMGTMPSPCSWGGKDGGQQPRHPGPQEELYSHDSPLVWTPSLPLSQVHVVTKQ